MVDHIKVYPFDSEISCLAQGFYALKARQLIKDGVDSPEEIIKELEEMKKQSVRILWWTIYHTSSGAGV